MITDFIFNPVPAGDRMGILILILPHSSSAGGNLKSPEALNLTLFAAAAHSLLSLTAYAIILHVTSCCRIFSV